MVGCREKHGRLSERASEGECDDSASRALPVGRKPRIPSEHVRPCWPWLSCCLAALLQRRDDKSTAGRSRGEAWGRWAKVQQHLPVTTASHTANPGGSRRDTAALHRPTCPSRLRDRQAADGRLQLATIDQRESHPIQVSTVCFPSACALTN